MNLKIIFSIVVIIFLAKSTICQVKIIEGKIQSESGPIPYATIGVKGKNLGTVSDENGHFKFSLETTASSLETEEIIVSSLGYSEKLFKLKDIGTSSITIVLTKKGIPLKEIVIRTEKLQEKKLGNSTRAILTGTTIFSQGEKVDDALGREIGMILKTDGSFKLKDFNLYITGNQFKNVKFRLQFYDLSTGKPTLIPVQNDILFDASIRKGWLKVDLVPYNVFIEDMKEIGVTIQWVKSELLNEKSRYFVISSDAPLFSKGLYRPESEASWLFPKFNLSLYLTVDTY